MTWHYINILSVFVVSLHLVPAVQARSTDQFHHFFTTWEETLIAARDNNCSQEWKTYTNPNSNMSYNYEAYDLASCILQNTTEFSKVEMAVVSVVLRLLPSVLILIGPTTAEISLLLTCHAAPAAVLAARGFNAISPLCQRESLSKSNYHT